MKKQISLAVILMIIVQIFPVDFRSFREKNAQAALQEIIYESTTWTLDNAPVIIDNKEYLFKSDLTIKEGVNIFLKNGSKIIVEGNLKVEGKKNHPVIFNGMEEGEYNYYVSKTGVGDVEIDYATFMEGGTFQCSAMNKRRILNSAYAQTDCIPLAALNLNADNIHITNSDFAYNYKAINVYSGEDVSIFGNRFYHNKEAALFSKEEKEIGAANNCWMRPSGPIHSDNPEGKGEKIEGNINFINWQKCGSDFKPVVIIPGFGGSWNWDQMLAEIPSENWGIIPTFHGYSNLLQSFKDRGYENNRDLFVVHYDWRKDNQESTKNFFKPTLEKIKEISFDEKYDIVAHSMGGFVALEYLYDKDLYEDNIDKVVLQGTPLLGSSKAYPVWEGGEIPKGWEAMELYLWALSKKKENWGKDYYDLIHDHIPSVKQLLPLYNYIVKNDTGNEVNVWEMQEKNEYISGLMQKISENMGNFPTENVLVLEGTGVDTSKMVRVDTYDGENSDKLWKDGKPNPYPLAKEDTAGDGTVLNLSSSGTPFFASNQIESADHTDLLTMSLGEMSDFLGIERPAKEYELASKDQLVFAFACPVDIKIVSASGKILSKSQNTFPEGKAFYYDDGKEDGYKILEILEPETDYQVEITGNGDGDYDAFVFKTDGEKSIETEFSGKVSLEQKIEYKIALDEPAKQIIVQEETSDIIPPTITISSPEDGKKYQNTGMLKFSFEVSDNLSSKEDIQMQTKFDEDITDDKEVDLSLIGLGQHDFAVDAKDQAGNQAQESVRFELETSLDSLILNTAHYRTLGLVKNKAVGNYILANLWQIKALVLYKENLLRNFKGHPIAVKQLDRILENLIVKKIEILARQIEKLSTQKISPLAVERLVEGLEFVKQSR